MDVVGSAIRKVLVRCSLDLLGDLLHLPKDVNLLRVVEDVATPREVVLVLDGPGLPERFRVVAGGRIKCGVAVISAIDDKVEWVWKEGDEQ